MKSFLQRSINLFLKHIRSKFIRFVFVGMINTLFGFGVYSMTIFAGFSYICAALISQVAGVLFNFYTTGALVFENNDKRLIFKFILSYIVTYIINVFVNRYLQLLLNCNQYISGFGAILVSSLCSFFILKMFVYRK